MTPEAFDKFLRSDIAKWAEVVKQFHGPSQMKFRTCYFRCPSIHFRLNGAETAIDADPDTPLLTALRGPLGLTGSHFGCGAGECGACTVIVNDHAINSCDTPLWSVADKDITTIEGLGSEQYPACAAARLHRRTGAAMRLLRIRNPDERRRIVEAKCQSDQRGGEGRARPQPVPLRFA